MVIEKAVYKTNWYIKIENPRYNKLDVWLHWCKQSDGSLPVRWLVSCVTTTTSVRRPRFCPLLPLSVKGRYVIPRYEGICILLNECVPRLDWIVAEKFKFLRDYTFSIYIFMSTKNARVNYLF